jgi:aminoglycoside phosphotransferase (APT) family kinase protein
MLTEDEISTLASYLGPKLGAGAVSLENVTRLHGGASRETYTLDAVTASGRRGLIMRRDPADSLIDTERELEFQAYRSFFGRGVPVPEAIALEPTADVLGRPFFIMERIDGGTAASPFMENAYDPYGPVLGRQFFEILGRIHSVDPNETPLAAIASIPAPEACALRELSHWEKVIDEDEAEPQPIARAAIRRLRKTLPPPAKRLTVVHGDYRSGNFLHDGAGRLIAILDWEMAHFGDPLEDLAWALDPLWRHRGDLAGGMLPPEEAIAIWESASGLKADPEALEWWSMFASLKGQAIWISSQKAFASGLNPDPVLAFSGWFCLTEHDAIQMGRLK